ncbi:MAG: protein-tyrosine phosphatase family protein [Ktedonobacterales bacterium]
MSEMAVRNFFWLYQGAIAGSARPGGEMSLHGSIPPGKTQGEALDDDLLWLRDQGIGAVLSLTETPLPAATLDRLELAWLHLPIDDQTAPTQADLLAALDFIDQQRVAGRGVLVHCRIGEGRTGAILAAYLIRQGATAEQALEHLRAFRPGAVSSPEQQRALAHFAADRAWII